MLKLSPSNWQNTAMNNSFLFAPPGGRGDSEFEVTGMIEGFFGGLKFSILGFFGYENLASTFRDSLI